MIALILAAAVAALPAPVRGDFDHDGKPDVARLSPRADGDYVLVVDRGAKGAPDAIVTMVKAADLASFYIGTEKPGRLLTWCGKGGGSKDALCPRDYITLTGDTLDFGATEASQAVAVWNGKAFDVIQLSD